MGKEYILRQAIENLELYIHNLDLEIRYLNTFNPQNKYRFREIQQDKKECMEILEMLKFIYKRC